MNVDSIVIGPNTTLVVYDSTGKTLGTFGPFPFTWTIPKLTAAQTPQAPPGPGLVVIWIDGSNIINYMDETGTISKFESARKIWPVTMARHAVVIGNDNGVVKGVAPGASGTVLASNGPDVDPTFQNTPLVGFTNHGILVGQGASPVSAIAPGTSGQVLTSNGAAADPSFQTVASNDPVNGYSVLEDFLGGAATDNNALSEIGLGTFALYDSSINNGSIQDPGFVDTTSPGNVSVETGTNNNGIGWLFTASAGGFIIGGFSWFIQTRAQLVTLSTGVDRYTTRILLNNGTAGDGNAMFFRYCDNVNGGKWQAVSRAAGVETAIDTGVAASAGAWHTYKIAINAAGTSATYFIDGTLVATITTNLPTGEVQQISTTMTKSVGTTNRKCYQDYIWYSSGAIAR